jgi:hypothetical protein
MSLLEKSAIERAALPRRAAAPDALAPVLASPFLGAALAVAALAQQLAGHLDCDVSWFLTFAEKIVDGATPYVDVTDPNPPASFLTLVPAVLLARALQLAPETMVAALVLTFAAGSIAFSFYLLRHGAARSRRAWMLLLNAAIFLLLVAPAIVFAEREHIALLALLPLLAALAVEERRARAPRAARRLAGLGGGIAVALKPHFALAILLPALAIAWRERSLRPLWRDELIVAALAAAFYALLVFLCFPAYIAEALPLALEVYAPARDDLVHLLTHSLAPAYAALLAGFLVAARGVVLGRATLVALIASIGFFATFLIQGKGWINHAFPALALILLAFTLLALRDRTARTGPPAAATPALIKFLFLPALVAAPACFGLFDLLSDREEHPGLLEAATTVAPPHPRVATIASQLDFGHPLVRRLEGEWMGRQNALWVTALVGRLLPSAGPERRARLEARRHADLEALAHDLRDGRPDIIVVEDGATRKFVLDRPETAGALDSYRLAARAGEIEIWRRSTD